LRALRVGPFGFSPFRAAASARSGQGDFSPRRPVPEGVNDGGGKVPGRGARAGPVLQSPPGAAVCRACGAPAVLLGGPSDLAASQSFTSGAGCGAFGVRASCLTHQHRRENCRTEPLVTIPAVVFRALTSDRLPEETRSSGTGGNWGEGKRG